MKSKNKPMKRLWLRVNALALAVTVSFTAMPTSSHAGLKEAMNQMFVSSSTSPQMIETQRLMGVYGGAMSLRPAGQGINIIQFAPPSIDAGCGGIDIFFGSFSFINGAQFEQLIRSIAANAVGFAIKSAINGMCSPCGAILEELEQAIRDLNSMARNTCAIANAMFDPKAREKLVDKARGIGERLKTVVSKTADAIASINQSQSEKPAKTAEGGGSQATKDANPVTGNIVYRAAKETLNSGTNTLRNFMSEKEAIEMVIGLFGTVIMPPPNNADKCAETPDERCGQQPKSIGPSITTWGMLFEPEKFSPNGVTVNKCMNSDCTSMTTGTIPLNSWGGIDKIINLGMFGVEDPMFVGPSGFTANSIVGSFVHKVPLTNQNIDQRARMLVAMVPLPILSAMREVQHIKGGPEMLGYQIAQMLPPYFEYVLASELLSIGSNVFTGQSKVSPPEGFTENLTLKAQTLQRPAAGDLANMMNKSIESVRNMRALTGSNLQTSGSSTGK